MVASLNARKSAKTENPKARIERLRSELRRRTGCASAAFQFGTAELFQLSMLPTQIESLDLILGGGFPRGGIVEIFGPNQSGKTTFAFQAIAQSQAEGSNAAFVDAEHRFNPAYAQALGVNLEALIVSRPADGDDALEGVIHLVNSGDYGIVVVDSVSALVPKDYDGGSAEAFIWMQEAMMSAALARLTAVLNASQSPCVVIFVNQLREKPVVYGSPEYTTGGKALGYYSSVRLDLRRIQTLKGREAEYGIKVKVKAVKTSHTIPNQFVEVDLCFGKGFQGAS